MKKYFSYLSLTICTFLIFVLFIFPEAMPNLPESGDTLLIVGLIIVAFLFALFSVKGPLKIVAVAISSIGIAWLLFVVIFAISMIFFGNFGS